VTLTGRTVDELFTASAAAFSETMTALDRVEPRQAEELDVAAPELDLLLVDFLSELLYRFDTRGWLTRRADVEVRSLDGGWELQGTLVGERLDATRHATKVLIKAVTYHGLEVVQRDGLWTARVVFDI
jgi:SHS2 domain-containing protein